MPDTGVPSSRRVLSPRKARSAKRNHGTVRFSDPARVYHADLRSTSGRDTRLYCIVHTPQSNASRLLLLIYYNTCSHSSVVRATVEFTIGRLQPAMPQYYRYDFFLSQKVLKTSCQCQCRRAVATPRASACHNERTGETACRIRGLFDVATSKHFRSEHDSGVFTSPHTGGGGAGALVRERPFASGVATSSYT